MGKVLVIGADGFVGNAVLRALQDAPALVPVAGTRRASGRTDGVEDRVCDATDRQSLHAALAGIDSAVCCMLASGQEMVAATRLLCEAAAQQRVRRVVLMSSMSVYGAAEGLVDEAAPLTGAELGAYGAAKVACERIAATAVAEGGPICVLRPGIVYGPGGDQWIGRFGRLLRAGRIGDLGALGDGLCNLVHKDDVAAAALAALSAPGAMGQAFNLSDDTDATWNDFISELGCLIGVGTIRRIPSRRLRLEARLAAPPLQLLKLAQARFAKRSATLLDPIPPSLLALWQQRIRLDRRRAEAALGMAWTPRAQGLAASAEWFLGKRAMARRSLKLGRELPT